MASYQRPSTHPPKNLKKATARTSSGGFWKHCLSLAVVVSFFIQPGTSTAQTDFPGPTMNQLVADFQCFVAAQPLRKTLQTITESTKEPRLPIILDRRIDPTSPLQNPASSTDVNTASFDETESAAPIQLGPTLYDALETVAKQRNGVWVSIDEAILIGPDSRTISAATEILASRKLVEQSRFSFPPKQVVWPALSTPMEALQIVADTWQLDVSQIDLPHDLWPAVSLPQFHVSSALGIIGSQFDVHLALDPRTRRVTSTPLNPNATLTRQYPAATLNPQDRPAKLKKISIGWELTGDACSHISS